MRIPRKYGPSSGLRPDRNARSVNPGADRGSAAPNICKASPWRTRGPATTADCRTTAALRQKQSGLPPDRNRGQAARYRRHMDGRRNRPQRSGAVGNSDMEGIIAYDGSSDRIICDFGIRQTTVNNRPPHQKLFAAGSRLQRRSQPEIPFGHQPQQPFPGQNLFDTKDIIHADGL